MAPCPGLVSTISDKLSCWHAAGPGVCRALCPVSIAGRASHPRPNLSADSESAGKISLGTPSESSWPNLELHLLHKNKHTVPSPGACAGALGPECTRTRIFYEFRFDDDAHSLTMIILLMLTPTPTLVLSYCLLLPVTVTVTVTVAADVN